MKEAGERMNEELFLQQLSIQLKNLPEEDVAEIIADYEDYFAKARANGLSDKEAIENLGTPRDIVQDILATRKSEASSQTNSRSVFLAIALILFNVMIVLGPAIGLIGAFFGLLVGVVAFIIAPIFTIVKVVVFNGALFEMFVSFFLCGIGVLIVPYFKLGAEVGYDLLRKYYRWNIAIVKGENM